MMSSFNAASFGEVSSSSFCSASLVLAEVMAPNTFITRVSSEPACSSATKVFLKLGLAGLLAIFSTSSRFCLMPASIAGA